MHNLGETRSSYQRTHLLQTPDTFIRTTLPGMKNASAIVHAAPQIGAAFTQYTAEFEADGELGPAPAQRFVYVLDGKIDARSGAQGKVIGAGDIVYVPRGDAYRLQVKSPFARYALVCSTPWLENRIDSMTPQEAEQARVNLKPN